MTARHRLAALLGAAALALAACGGSAGTATPATAPTAGVDGSAAPSEAPAASPSEAPAASASDAPEACEVEDGDGGVAAEIRGFAFPAGLTVGTGETVTWTNADSAPHTVTFDDGSCNTQIGGGATVTVRYDVAGTFAFHCAIHPSMTGTLVVGG